MNLDFADFIHPNHVGAFVGAARSFRCHILVRKTGRAALGWVARRGYTGKRADLKAKTANQNTGPHQLAGLVCSPLLVPQAFTADRLTSARAEWGKCAHLITVPDQPGGFDDSRQPRGCPTPYLVQTNRRHKHYGCVALVDMGLLVPRYVHGDYDLYAIIPAGKAFDPTGVTVRTATLGSTMSPDRMGLKDRLNLAVPNLEGPLSFRVAAFINNQIERISPDLLGSLMVNHGEQVNIGASGRTFEPVLAIRAAPRDGQWGQILATREEHQRFYQSA